MSGIKVNDVELAYEEYGSGEETLMFTHGWQTANGRSRELALRSAPMISGAKILFFQNKIHMLIAGNQQQIINEIKLFVDQLNKNQR